MAVFHDEHRFTLAHDQYGSVTVVDTTLIVDEAGTVVTDAGSKSRVIEPWDDVAKDEEPTVKEYVKNARKNAVPHPDAEERERIKTSDAAWAEMDEVRANLGFEEPGA